MIKNKKAQNTAEYAILISLVVAGIIAMQTYAQRALQARVRDASIYMANTISTAGTDMGATVQYEPYYLSSNYVVGRDDTTIEIQDNQTVRREEESTSSRYDGGFQESKYAGFGLENGI